MSELREKIAKQLIELCPSSNHEVTAEPETKPCPGCYSIADEIVSAVTEHYEPIVTGLEAVANTHINTISRLLDDKRVERKTNFVAIQGRTMTVPSSRGRIRSIGYDWELQCPECWCWGIIDEDMLHGRVSTDHSGLGVIGRPSSPAEGRECAFHEIRDWFTTAEKDETL